MIYGTRLITLIKYLLYFVCLKKLNIIYFHISRNICELITGPSYLGSPPPSPPLSLLRSTEHLEADPGSLHRSR